MPTARGVHAWTPFFYTITKESEVLLMAQAFLTYDEQLDKLQTEKELSIPDLSYGRPVVKRDGLSEELA